MKRKFKVSFTIILILVMALSFQTSMTSSAGGAGQPGDYCTYDSDCDDCLVCGLGNMCEADAGAQGSACSTCGSLPCECDAAGQCMLEPSGTCSPACNTCQKCDSTNTCVTDTYKNGLTCTGCAGANGCECEVGLCVEKVATSGKAAYAFKNEDTGIFDIFDVPSIDRFSCTGLAGVRIVDDGTKYVVSDDSTIFCGSNRVICGFMAGSDGDDGELDEIHCCKVEAISGGVVSLQSTNRIDPDGDNAEGRCSGSSVGYGAQQGGRNDGVHAVDCANVLINGVVTARVNPSSDWQQVTDDYQDLPCGSGGGPSTPTNTFPCAAACPGDPNCAKCCKCGDSVSSDGSCFVAGTRILLADGGSKNIEDIQAGDAVRSFDVESKGFVSGKVKKVLHHALEDMSAPYYLILNGEVKVTVEHRFLTPNGWLHAGNLQLGSLILTSNGYFVAVNSIEKVQGKVPTYNFEVENYPLYIADGFVVHNAKAAEGLEPVLNLDFGNAVTGAIIADFSACPSGPYTAQTCDEIYTIHSGICGCGTKVAACELITSQSDCNAIPQCSWCPAPDKQVFPYNYSYYANMAVITGGRACVNKTRDPFNCGACGFAEGGLATAAGFCPADTPFCVNSDCVGRSGASATSVKFSSNPYVFYTSEGSETAGYKSKWPAGETNSVYSLKAIDEIPSVCSAVGGSDFSSELGCCGNNKCRVSSGLMCNSTSLCDGSRWHDGTNYGEIFKTACEPFPIANINGAFVKCIDDDEYRNFAQMQTYDASAGGGSTTCVPNYVRESFSEEFYGAGWCDRGKNPGAECVNELNGIDTALFGVDYSCGAGKYSKGSVRVLGYDPCKIHPFTLTAGGDLVCVWPDENLGKYGFATILDNPDHRAIENWYARDTAANQEYAHCPSLPAEWITRTGTVVSPIATMPCPGKITISSEGGGASIAGYAGPSDDGKYVMFCRGLTINEKPSGGTTSLNFSRGNLSLMGSVNNRSYMCYTNYNTVVPAGESRARIAICCGPKNPDGCSGVNIPNPVSGGIKFYAGDRLAWNSSATNITLYCLLNGSWSEDLDYNYAQDACANASYFATGKYCCAEGDDTRTWINESYNDPGSSKGACFKGQPQSNGILLKYKLYNGTSVTNNDVMVYNGTFMGCGFNITNFTAEMDLNNQSLCDLSKPLTKECLESIEDWPNPGKNFSIRSVLRTNKPLVKNAEYCTMLNTAFGNFYCSYSNNWADSLGENLSHKSDVPDDLLLLMQNITSNANLAKSNCCLPNQCWDPSAGACIAEQIGVMQYYAINESTAYKCLQGTWVNVFAKGKRTPDGCYAGICPDATQCFYKLDGNPRQNNNVTSGANPQCLADGQYIADSLCINGSWVSRTKMLAQKLVSLVGSDEFTLMCGPPPAVLNNYKQNLGDSNNFCTLNLAGQRIIGTTLNQPLINTTTHADFLTAVEQNFLNLSYRDSGLSFSHTCTAQTKDFAKCVDISGYLTLYYDDDYQMVLISTANINGLTPSLGDRICDAVPSWLKWICPTPPAAEKNMENLQLFQKLYAANFNNKLVFGVAEQTCDPTNLKKTNLYTFNYTGFTNVDLKYLINPFEASNVTIAPNNVLVLNPKKDPWASLTLLRNPEQQ